AYAEANGLVWHEDSTNTDQKYRRNFVRQSVIKKAKQKSPQEDKKLLVLLRRQRELNQAIDQQLETMLHLQPSRISLRRSDIISLPFGVPTVLVADRVSYNGSRGFIRWIVEKTTVPIRTGQPTGEIRVDSQSMLSFCKRSVEFVKITK